jgi:hypothetical protein
MNKPDKTLQFDKRDKKYCLLIMSTFSELIIDLNFKKLKYDFKVLCGYQDADK